MKLKNFLFERSLRYEMVEIDKDKLVIIDIEGCDENSYELTLPSGEEIDCSEISEQFYPLFSSNGVRILGKESPYSALINSNGDLLGGIVVSYDVDFTSEEEDYEELFNKGVVTFSVAVDPSVQRQGFARKLIEDLLKNKKKRLIRAQVINPNMVPLLTSLGFQKTSEEGSREGLIYTKNN